MLTWDTMNNVGIPFEWASLNTAQQAALTAGDPHGQRQSVELSARRPHQRNQFERAPVCIARATPSSATSWIRAPPGWVRPTRRTRRRGRIASLRPRSCRKTRGPSPMCSSRPRNRPGSMSSMSAPTTDSCTDSAPAVSTSTGTSSPTPDAQRRHRKSGLHARIDCWRARRRPAAAGRLHQRCDYRNRGAKHPRRDAGHRHESPQCVEPLLDYANPQYGHNFFVDATPGSGDLYYGGQWHTWLVGGLGAGGAAIYALDVTESSAASPRATRRTSSSANGIPARSPAPTSRAAATIWATPSGRRKSAACTTATGASIFGNGFGSVRRAMRASTSCRSTARSGATDVLLSEHHGSDGTPRRQWHRLCDAGRPGRRSHHRLRLCGRSQRQCVALRPDGSDPAMGRHECGGISVNALSGGGALRRCSPRSPGSRSPASCWSSHRSSRVAAAFADRIWHGRAYTDHEFGPGNHTPAAPSRSTAFGTGT